MSQPKYKMPRPTQVVVWRATPSGAPSPAIVTHVGQTAVNLAIVPPDSRALLPKDAVRHVSDPLVANQLSPDEGVWDYTDDHKLLVYIAQIVASESDVTNFDFKQLVDRISS